MRIARWQKCSLSAYPGKRSVVLVTSGCNLRCYHCRNRSFLVDRPVKETIPLEAVLAYLSKYRDSIDALVLQGGEPTLQKGLAEFLIQVKSLGLCVKLHTNGSNPDCLESLFVRGLVDYVSMGLKAPPSKMKYLMGVSLPDSHVKKSKEVILASGIDHNFSTTVLPEFTFSDVLEIARSVAGARRFVLRQYRKPDGFTRSQYSSMNTTPHGPAFFYALQDQMSGWFSDIVIRGVKPHPPVDEGPLGRADWSFRAISFGVN